MIHHHTTLSPASPSASASASASPPASASASASPPASASASASPLASPAAAPSSQEAEDSADVYLNQGKALQKLIESPKLDPKLDHLIVSCHGSDKVGLLHQFAVACHSHDASISESKMVRMGGQFMMMMVVSVDPAMTRQFQAMLQVREDGGKHISTRHR